MAGREALHIVAGPRSSKQDFRWEGAVVKDAAHQQSGRVIVTAGRHHGRANRHRVGRILSPVIGARVEGEGRHRRSAQDRCSVLQYASPRHVLRGSWRGVLRRPLPAARVEQSSTTSEVAGICPEADRTGCYPGGCFLGKSRRCRASRWRRTAASHDRRCRGPRAGQRIDRRGLCGALGFTRQHAPKTGPADCAACDCPPEAKAGPGLDSPATAGGAGSAARTTLRRPGSILAQPGSAETNGDLVHIKAAQSKSNERA